MYCAMKGSATGRLRGLRGLRGVLGLYGLRRLRGLRGLHRLCGLRGLRGLRVRKGGAGGAGKRRITCKRAPGGGAGDAALLQLRAGLEGEQRIQRGVAEHEVLNIVVPAVVPACRLPRRRCGSPLQVFEGIRPVGWGAH